MMMVVVAIPSGVDALQHPLIRLPAPSPRGGEGRKPQRQLIPSPLGERAAEQSGGGVRGFFAPTLIASQPIGEDF
jgi:hypothetical protein